MVREGRREAPHLDDFMVECESSRKINLRWVLKDRKRRLVELRSYYAKNHARLNSQLEFNEFYDIRNEVAPLEISSSEKQE